jgi:hypothetical protein
MPCDDCRASSCPDQERARWLREHLMQSLAMPRRFPSVRDLLLANLVARAGLVERTEDDERPSGRHASTEERREQALPDAQPDAFDGQLRRPRAYAEQPVRSGGYL